MMVSRKGGAEPEQKCVTFQCASYADPASINVSVIGHGGM